MEPINPSVPIPVLHARLAEARVAPDVTPPLERTSAWGAASTTVASVLLQVQRAEDVLGQWWVRPDELRLPQTFKEAKQLTYEDVSATLPDDVLAGLRLVGAPSEPLWLEFGQPRGTLPLLPWERLLQSLNRPIVRLPYYELQPVATTTWMDIVVCATAPAIKDDFALPDLTAQVVVAATSLPGAVHVFADVRFQAPLRATLAAHLASGRVTLHDPTSASAYPVAERQRVVSGDLDSPWLLWILETLGERGADMVHFVSHGYLGTEHGALAVAASPAFDNSEVKARFLTAPQLATFLRSLGAWSVGFTSPRMNYSSMGLRLLADQLARARPGPVLLHEERDDPSGKSVQQAYDCLYRDAPPPTRGISLYAHPAHILKLPRTAEAPEDSVVSDQMRAILEAGHSIPSWVGAAQRSVEQPLARLGRRRASSTLQELSQRGIEDALKIFSAAVDANLPRSKDGTE